MPSEASRLAFGDVILIPFPFTDQSAAKRRPAVVISSGSYNDQHPDIILMPVTSQLRANARPDHLFVEEWEAAGLLKRRQSSP